VISLGWFFKPRHYLRFVYAPFESRDDGTFSEPVDFAGETYPTDTGIRSQWRQHDIRAQWGYDLIGCERWEARLGVGLILQDTYASLRTTEGTEIQSAVEDIAFFPYLLANLGYDFSPRWKLGLLIDWMSLDNDKILDLGLSLNYRIARVWDCTAGFLLYQREISTDELYNDVEYQIPYVAVAHGW
jgi:hypothetical protein